MHKNILKYFFIFLVHELFKQRIFKTFVYIGKLEYIIHIEYVSRSRHAYLINGKILEQSQCARKILKKMVLKYILAVNGMECNSL